jgi:peptidoglycan/LPS O-acetylase OafA/YrhL
MVTPRRRLDHVDAMRPVKQAGVISTHAILFFAPAAASVSSGAALLLLHVSREGFFFVSASMLMYAYPRLGRADLPRYYWRRFVSVGAPYLCWTLIYFLFLMPSAHYHGAGQALGGLAAMARTGYFQLYFLLVIMQFYLVFPLVAMLMRRTRGHHGLVVAAAVAAQVAITIATHWRLLPAGLERYSQQDALSYLLYLVGGCVVACHLEQVDAWVRRHARRILLLTVASALAAEAVYWLADNGVTSTLGGGTDAFQPSVIPFNVGAIACGYLAGVALVRPGRSRATKAAVRAGVDDAYGIYLSHLLVLTTLSWLGWGRLSAVVPWPVLCLLTVGIVVAVCGPLTELLARTPLAVPLTGRRRVGWAPPLAEGDHADGLEGDGDPAVERAGERLQVGAVGGQQLLQEGQLGVGRDGDVGPDLEGAVRVGRVDSEDRRLRVRDQVRQLLPDAGQ